MLRILFWLSTLLSPPPVPQMEYWDEGDCSDNSRRFHDYDDYCDASTDHTKHDYADGEVRW